MLQAIGLTSTSRRYLAPAVDDLTFEARPGDVTALLGARGSGKSTALLLMLGLEEGRGITYFRGRPLHAIANPAREVGVLLGDVPGHPARTARGQLRMLCAAAGVPVSRADDMLDLVGIAALRDARLGSLSLGMDRRLGLASALLGDPHTLLLDAPSRGLSPREHSWLFGLLRAHAAHGGTVLYTTADPKEAARTADRVVTVDKGRLVADQDVADFARTRLRPRVAVLSPHAVRLAAALSHESRAARRSVEVVAEGGNRLSVYGSSCAEIGDAAFRHGVLVHQLADEIGDAGPRAVPARAQGADEATGAVLDLPATGAASAPGGAVGRGGTEQGNAAPRACPDGAQEHAAAHDPVPRSAAPNALDHPSAAPHRVGSFSPAGQRSAGPAPATPPLSRAGRGPSRAGRVPSQPLQPLRYELRRFLGVRTTHLITAAVLVSSAVLSVLLAYAGRTPLRDLLAAWPEAWPLPPAAFGAGVLGALSFGDEFRYPALAAARGTVPRRLGLLLAKLTVTAVAALVIGGAVVVLDAQALWLLYGSDPLPVFRNWPALGLSWVGLLVGCAWSGLLAAGTFRLTAAGVAAVLAVPMAVVPLVQQAYARPSGRSVAGFPGRLRELTWLQWPYEVDRWLLTALRALVQPVGTALALSLSILFCSYLIIGLRDRVRC
ncbi:ATP-binding cassette domain-containing protein [Streptomyces sp. WMMC940]|uniref:ATP-binding cassette domain-containing protein n=1 Tax=Streptomyces sp. WMMC940 TaxID=3015153 RepID=UPI0022B722C7|nr:ATP-binding cassette domain-containing protein [Streptomyces sp. WMMC940]MCZ7457566.1 ATP-binding cassette domain-containing protein [Streptomyces sp. WMMC940]